MMYEKLIQDLEGIRAEVMSQDNPYGLNLEEKQDFFLVTNTLLYILQNHQILKQQVAPFYMPVDSESKNKEEKDKYVPIHVGLIREDSIKIIDAEIKRQNLNLTAEQREERIQNAVQHALIASSAERFIQCFLKLKASHESQVKEHKELETKADASLNLIKVFCQKMQPNNRDANGGICLDARLRDAFTFASDADEAPRFTDLIYNGIQDNYQYSYFGKLAAILNNCFSKPYRMDVISDYAPDQQLCKRDGIFVMDAEIAQTVHKVLSEILYLDPFKPEIASNEYPNDSKHNIKPDPYDHFLLAYRSVKPSLRDQFCHFVALQHPKFLAAFTNARIKSPVEDAELILDMAIRLNKNEWLKPCLASKPNLYTTDYDQQFNKIVILSAFDEKPNPVAADTIYLRKDGTQVTVFCRQSDNFVMQKSLDLGNDTHFLSCLSYLENFRKHYSLKYVINLFKCTPKAKTLFELAFAKQNWFAVMELIEAGYSLYFVHSNGLNGCEMFLTLSWKTILDIINTKQNHYAIYFAILFNQIKFAEYLNVDFNKLSIFTIVLAAERKEITLETFRWLIGKIDFTHKRQQVNQALFAAADTNQLEKVKLLLQLNADLSYVDSQGNNALHLAIKHSHLDIAHELLLKLDPKWLYAKNKSAETYLQIAAQNKHWALFSLLLKKGFNYNFIHDSGDNAIELAAIYQGWDALEEILLGISPEHNCQASFGIALLYAAFFKQWPLVKKLLLTQPDSKIYTSGGHSVVHEAVFQNEVNSFMDEKGQEQKSYLEQLLNTGFDINGQANKRKNPTPLHVAAKYQQVHLSTLTILLKNPLVKVNLVNSRGETALMLAVKYGSLEKVKAFLEHPDIVVEICRDDGENALSLALKLNTPEIAKALLRHLINYKYMQRQLHEVGFYLAKLYELDQNDFQELFVEMLKKFEEIELSAIFESLLPRIVHTVIRLGQIELLEQLITTLSIDICFKNDESLLHLAARYNQPAIIQLLLDRLITVDLTNVEGRTALDIAARYESWEAFSILAHHRSQKLEAQYFAAREKNWHLFRQLFIQQEWEGEQGVLHRALLYNDRVTANALLKQLPLLTPPQRIDLESKNVLDPVTENHPILFAAKQQQISLQTFSWLIQQNRFKYDWQALFAIEKDPMTVAIENNQFSKGKKLLENPPMAFSIIEHSFIPLDKIKFIAQLLKKEKSFFSFLSSKKEDKYDWPGLAAKIKLDWFEEAFILAVHSNEPKIAEDIAKRALQWIKKKVNTLDNLAINRQLDTALAKSLFQKVHFRQELEKMKRPSAPMASNKFLN